MKRKTRCKALLAALCLSIALSSHSNLVTQASQANNEPVKSASGYQITEEANPEVKMPNQPTSSFWMPSELLEWNAAEDADVEFNISKIPLAKRVEKEKLESLKDTQSKDMKVASISIMNRSTSGNPSQGTNRFNSNTFTYWQYIDTLVYWGGSASEGLIVPPSADVTNAAHKNGVPVLGTVFFPQQAHGGKLKWLDEFLSQDANGNFTMADKLIEVARLYGFDGWFINQETEGDETTPLTAEHAALIQAFIKALKAKAPDLQVMWYDSMTKEGKMDWQNALTEENQMFLRDQQEPVSDSIFLNFWWTSSKNVDKELLKASNEQAQAIGFPSNELYAGIDVQASGILTPIRWDLLQKSGNEYYTSIGLYCPSWTYFSASDFSDFEQREKAFWVNTAGNPAESLTTGSGWSGISAYAVEKSVVNTYPFTTNFNVGNGYSFFINGEKISALDWNNRGASDIMPTYRWMIENEGNNKLSASINYANAWYGGNSIQFRGALDAGKASLIHLYAADLSIEPNTLFTTSVKGSVGAAFDLVLTLADGTTETVKGDKVVGNDWTSIAYDVSALTGKTVKRISYKVVAEKESKSVDLYLGNVTITTDAKVASSSIQDFKATQAVFDEDQMYAGVRFTWKESEEGITRYEIYRVNADGSKSFLGQSVSTNFFVNALPREPKGLETRFEVVGVNQNMQRGQAAQTSIEWPDNSIPKANFVASKTLVAPGEAISFESRSSANTESLIWEFPGADKESSTEDTPVITYSKEGVYPVLLTAKNDSGENKVEIADLIVVSAKAKGELVNLSENKNCEASSFVNNNEAPNFAVDGKTNTKWCAVGTPPHTITIDLGEMMTISQVAMAHAEAGGESPDMNTMSYTIEVSNDNKVFTEVAAVTKNSAANTVDAFAPINARYVKVTAKKPTQGSDSAVRIYEIQVFGLTEALAEAGTVAN